jgi:hypothetical protein
MTPHGGTQDASQHRQRGIIHLTRHTAKWAKWGGAIGVPTWLSALWCTGFGHGTCIPIPLSSSPLSLVPLPGFLCTPMVWVVIIALAAAPRTRRNQILFLALMAAHYAVAAALIAWTHAGNCEDVRVTWNRVPGVILAWAMFYCVAQVLAWGAFLGGVKPPPGNEAIS